MINSNCTCFFQTPFTFVLLLRRKYYLSQATNHFVSFVLFFSFQHSLPSISGNMMILLNMWVASGWSERQGGLGFGFGLVWFFACLLVAPLYFKFLAFSSRLVLGLVFGFGVCLFALVLVWGFFGHLHKCMLLIPKVFPLWHFFIFIFILFPERVEASVPCMFWGLAWYQSIQNWFVFFFLMILTDFASQFPLCQNILEK